MAGPGWVAPVVVTRDPVVAAAFKSAGYKVVTPDPLPGPGTGQVLFPPRCGDQEDQGA